MASTAPISFAIKEAILPALLSLESSIIQAMESQAELEADLNLLHQQGEMLASLPLFQTQGKSQISRGVDKSQISRGVDIQKALVRCDISRKRILNLERKISRICDLLDRASNLK